MGSRHDPRLGRALPRVQHAELRQRPGEADLLAHRPGSRVDRPRQRGVAEHRPRPATARPNTLVRRLPMSERRASGRALLDGARHVAVGIDGRGGVTGGGGVPGLAQGGRGRERSVVRLGRPAGQQHAGASRDRPGGLSSHELSPMRKTARGARGRRQPTDPRTRVGSRGAASPQLTGGVERCRSVARAAVAAPERGARRAHDRGRGERPGGPAPRARPSPAAPRRRPKSSARPRWRPG